MESILSERDVLSLLHANAYLIQHGWIAHGDGSWSKWEDGVERRLSAEQIKQAAAQATAKTS
jgi:hypothetical protein